MEEQLKQLMEAIQALTARVEAMEAANKPVEMSDEEKAAKEAAADEEAAKAAAAKEAAGTTDEEGEETPATMDAALKTIAALTGKIAALEARPAMDEAAVVTALARKNALADALSAHVGTFDHANMTAQQVAEYGVAKLEIKGVAKGSEMIALDAYLQAKPKPAETATTVTAADAANTSLGKGIQAYTTGAK